MGEISMSGSTREGGAAVIGFGPLIPCSPLYSTGESPRFMVLTRGSRTVVAAHETGRGANRRPVHGRNEQPALRTSALYPA